MAVPRSLDTLGHLAQQAALSRATLEHPALLVTIPEPYEPTCYPR